jgi:hypothetical protein
MKWVKHHGRHAREAKHLGEAAADGGNSSRPTGSFHFPRPLSLTNLRIGHFYFGNNRTFLFWFDNLLKSD